MSGCRVIARGMPAAPVRAGCRRRVTAVLCSMDRSRIPCFATLLFALGCATNSPTGDGSTLVAVELTPTAVTLDPAETQQFSALGRRADDATTSISPTWTATGGTISGTGLYTAGATPGTFRAVATLGELADTATVTIADPAPPAGTLLFSESFDLAGFTGRGWYDISADLPTSTVEKRPGGSVRSLQWQWNMGGVNPSPGSAARHLFTPTDRIYIRYWVKYSTNWVGSGQTSHPHEFNVLTTEDNDYAGPAFSRLTAYVEHNWRATGGFPILSLQDGVNIDQTKINQNLVGVSENRSTQGCNGFGDVYPGPGSCYLSGALYWNGRTFPGTSALWTDGAATPGYKSNWHKVEAYFQLNTVVAGIGQANGVIKYWFDDALILDLPGVLMRTGQRPTMLFNQFLLGPYMGNGSPVAQSAWIDDLVVATGRIP